MKKKNAQAFAVLGLVSGLMLTMGVEASVNQTVRSTELNRSFFDWSRTSNNDEEMNEDEQHVPANGSGKKAPANAGAEMKKKMPGNSGSVSQRNAPANAGGDAKKKMPGNAGSPSNAGKSMSGDDEDENKGPFVPNSYRNEPLPQKKRTYRNTGNGAYN